jgi:AcrR family transcriptional regulator
MSIIAEPISPPPEPKRRGRQRSAEAESAILHATMALLAKRSLRDVTAEEIARNAGVSKATLYKWWPNKNIVALDAFLASMQEAVAIPDTGSAEQDFRMQFEAAIDFYKNSSGRLLCHFIAEGQSDPELRQLFRERFLKPCRQNLKVIWQRGVARGEIHPDVDGDLVLDLIFGPMVYRLLVGHGPLDETQARTIIRTVFGGVRNPQSDWIPKQSVKSVPLAVSVAAGG